MREFSRSGLTFPAGPAQRAFLERLRQVALESGRPVMFGTISTRQGEAPNPYRYQLDYLDRSIAAGARMFGQTTTKSINAIFALKSYLPFDVLPHWRELRALPLAGAKAAHGGSCRARAACGGRGAHEAARQRVPGWRRGDHRSAQARLCQLVRDARRGVERSDRRIAGAAAGEASGGGDARPDAGERGSGVRAASGERGTGRRAGHAAASVDADHVLRFRRACVPGDGIVAANPHAELLGARAAGVHAGAGGAQADVSTMRRRGN